MQPQDRGLLARDPSTSGSSPIWRKNARYACGTGWVRIAHHAGSAVAVRQPPEALHERRRARSVRAATGQPVQPQARQLGAHLRRREPGQAAASSRPAGRPLLGRSSARTRGGEGGRGAASRSPISRSARRPRRGRELHHRAGRRPVQRADPSRRGRRRPGSSSGGSARAGRWRMAAARSRPRRTGAVGKALRQRLQRVDLVHAVAGAGDEERQHQRRRAATSRQTFSAARIVARPGCTAG